MKNVFMLGADDPEMRAMEKILKKRKLGRVSHATVDGIRVSPGSAYRADEVPGLIAGDTLVRIECEPVSVPTDVKVIVIDHHRPGDSGYDLGPEQFWEASSIGQLHIFLDVTPTRWRKTIAALDHCFSAALRNECPGVIGGEVLLMGVAEIVAQKKTGHTRAIQQIQRFLDIMKDAPEIIIGKQVVKDIRQKHLGDGYSFDLLTAQVAAAMGGYVALLRHRDNGDRSNKCTIVGHTSPETVKAFMEVWAPEQGLVRIYGVPARGYAGGYTSNVTCEE